MTWDTMNGDRDADVHAYIDGELDPERRIEFEAFLAANPSVAAQVHDYLHQREALRRGIELIAADPSRDTDGLAERLHHRLRLDLALRRFGPIAAAILLLVGGWNIGGWVQNHQHRAVWAAVPAFADEAAEAHSMAIAQTAGPPVALPADLNALAEALARRIGETSINLPDVDPNLTLVQAAMVPWHDGSALQFVYREPDGELLTLFVGVEDPVDDIGLHAIEQKGLQLVYWRKGAIAYTVTGSKTDSDLLMVAKKMADSVRRS